MSLRIPPHHPLQELLGKLLSGIEIVPATEQRRMVNRASREAVKWHKAQIEMMQWWVRDMERAIQSYNGVCPHCNRRLGSLGVHKEDCDLAIMLMAMDKMLEKQRKE